MFAAYGRREATGNGAQKCLRATVLILLGCFDFQLHYRHHIRLAEALIPLRVGAIQSTAYSCSAATISSRCRPSSVITCDENVIVSASVCSCLRRRALRKCW
jgi:hypothetical protein